MAKSLTIEVKVTPRASRDQIGGMRDGVLQVRVTAAPVDDAANTALLKLLAKAVGVPRSRLKIVRGARARRKLVAIEGAGPEVLERLGARP